MRLKTAASVLLITCISFTCLVSLYYFQQYKALMNDITEQTSKDALYQLSYTEREYASMKEQLVSIVSLLSNNQSLFDFIVTDNRANRELVEEGWKTVAVNQKWYARIRYVDIAGDEMIGVNYSRQNNLAYTTEKRSDIFNTPLYEYASGLQLREIGAWGLGSQPLPDSPSLTNLVLNIISPVDMLGTRVGYLILDLDIPYLASRLNYAPDQDFRPSVVNQHGYYVVDEQMKSIYGRTPGQDSPIRLNEQYRDQWSIAKNLQSYSAQTPDQGLLVFNKVELAKGQPLYLMIHLSHERLLVRAERDINDLYQQAFFVLALMLLFAIPTTSMMLYYRRRTIESKLARAALSGMTSVMITDHKHNIILVNDEFESITGYQNKDIEGKNSLYLLLQEQGIDSIKNVLNALEEAETWEGEIECVVADGSRLTAITRVQSIKDLNNKSSYYIVSLVDISERKELENKLRILSERDALTHIWNRRKFEAELVKQSNLTERYPDSHNVALALVDIDHFKRVNDLEGHDEGDKVIKSVAELLVQQLRTTDFVARIGGEEFALIMPHTRIDEAQLVLERIRHNVEVHSHIPVTISIGVTDLTEDSTRSYKWADIALYESKTAGRNKVSKCLSSDEIA
ncbi:diguanylate cyclase [Vibrio maerlii]|uniref:sensor domain-containing diguanylate cyclase n=1 Tax=Vibrio maerlii TaxID=2231648 RepID=UPI000E3DE831|nr:diguanylate cyclase [Vibrio maerlii]